MKILETSFLDGEEVSQLLKISPGAYSVKGSKNLIVNKVITRLEKEFNFTIKKESYWRIETKPKGHEWHTDTGANNHMMWCQVGVSILLTNTFTGGETYYADDYNKTNQMYLSNIFH